MTVTLNEVRRHIGQVLQFNYLAGTTPGLLRTVYVMGYIGHNDAIQGWCFDREKIRNFSRDQIRNVVEVSTQSISTIILPSDLDTVIDCYQADGKYVFHDSDNGRLVVFDLPKLSHILEHNILLIRGRNGGVKIDVSGGPKLTLYDDRGNLAQTVQHPSTLDIIDAIKGIE